MPDKAIENLLDSACRPYRQAGKFAWHFARGKLSCNPAFNGMLALGLLPAQCRILDAGCAPRLAGIMSVSARD